MNTLFFKSFNYITPQPNPCLHPPLTPSIKKTSFKNIPLVSPKSGPFFSINIMKKKPPVDFSNHRMTINFFYIEHRNTCRRTQGYFYSGNLSN